VNLNPDFKFEFCQHKLG